MSERYVHLVHTGDWHLTEGPRFAETARVLSMIFEQPDPVDAWLLAGDFFGTTVPYTPRPLERNRLAAMVAKRARVIMIYGNHDSPGELDIFGFVGAEVVSRPRTLAFPGPWLLVCIPYPRKGFMQAASVLERVSQGDVALSRVIRGRCEAPEYAPTVVLGHFNVAGSRTGGGEVMIGREIEISSHELDELPIAGALLSHIHEPQQVGKKGWYAGTPSAQNFGESDRHGYNYATLDLEHGELKVDWRQLPAKRLVQVPASFTRSHGFTLQGPVDLRNAAEVKLVLEFDEADREETKGAAEHAIVQMLATAKLSGQGLDAGQVGPHVKIEHRMRPTERVRAPQIAQAATMEEKVAAYWDTLEPPPPAEDRLGAVAVLQEILKG